MNRVVLVGRLTRDPELRTTQSGISVCNFGIAVDRRTKSDAAQTADFFNCIAWRKTGEIIARYLTKGREVALEGRLQSRSYEKDGIKRNVVEVVVDSFDFIGSKNDSNDSFENDFSLMADDDNDVPF